MPLTKQDKILGGLIYLSVDQLIINATFPIVLLDTILYDNCGCVDISQNGIVTPTFATWVQLSLSSSFQTNFPIGGGGDRGIAVLKNGVTGDTGTPRFTYQWGTLSASDIKTNTGAWIQTIPGDLFQLRAEQITGSDINLRSGFKTWLSALFK